MAARSMAMAFFTTVLAVVLLGAYAAAAACLPTNDAAVCHDDQQRNDGDLVATACEKAKGHEAHHYRGLGLTALTKEFCETTLRADNRSAAASDTRELALVAMDLVAAAAASAGTKARSALRSSGGRGSKDKDTEYSLRYCVMDYGTVAVVVPACRDIVEAYSPRDFQAPFDYLECAGRVMDVAGDCWQRVSYEDGALKRTLWNDAVDVANRANLAQALVEQMIDFPDDQE